MSKQRGCVLKLQVRRNLCAKEQNVILQENLLRRIVQVT